MDRRPYAVAVAVAVLGLVPETVFATDRTKSPPATAVGRATILKGLDLRTATRGQKSHPDRALALGGQRRIRSVDNEGRTVPFPHFGTVHLIVIDLP